MNEVPGLLKTRSGTGVVPIQGSRVNEVWWAHDCPVRNRWVYSGCPNHTLSGDAKEGSLTVGGSLICDECGKHGWINDNVWTEA